MKVNIAHSIRYGNYKSLLKTSKQLQSYTESIIDRLTSPFSLPDDVSMIIRPIRQSADHETMAQCSLEDHIVEIDPRICTPEISTLVVIKIMLHELTHIEQFHEGRLRSDFESFTWFGKKYNANAPHEEYLQWPWEIEANARANEVYIKHFR